jgi:hypothetical protein
MPRKKRILENPHVRDVMSQLMETPKGQALLGQVVDIAGKFGEIMDKVAKGEIPSLPQMKGATAQVVQRVVHKGATPREVLHFGVDEPLTIEKIKERKKTLALMVHPDAGGATDAMARINDAAAKLLKDMK